MGISEDGFRQMYQELQTLLTKMLKSRGYVAYLSVEEAELLTECPKGHDIAGDDSCEGYIGYPKSPLVRVISVLLARIMFSGTCPMTDLPDFPVFKEIYGHDERLNTIHWIRDQLAGALTLWDVWEDGRKMYMLSSVLRRLRRRGLLDLLKLRRTVGSTDLLPIPRERLLKTCEQLNDPRSKLTVCARALDKHAVRDSTKFWGETGGTEESKNARALEKVNFLLDNATWINIHQLPGAIPTIEIRIPEGYGVRFDYKPLAFRGFLEPQQEEGWLTRYRH